MDGATIGTNTKGISFQNPRNGIEVSVEAGQSVSFLFDVTNESPEIVCYQIIATEIPTEWISDAPKLDAPSGATDRVRVVLQPFDNANTGVYPLRLEIHADNTPINTTSLNLRVTSSTQTKLSVQPFSEPPKPIDSPKSDPIAHPTNGNRKPEEPPVILADMGNSFSGRQEVPNEEPDEENVVISGAKESGDNELFTVAPGKSLLVRLTIQNDGATGRNYVLEDDRLLDTNWLDLQQFDIFLDKAGVGELRFRLTPPTDAEPGAYPFAVRFGPREAARRMRQFTLVVPAIPAVRISTPETTLTRGFGRGSAVDFPLQVENAGNADTSFRVGVVNPAIASRTNNSLPDTPFLYQSGYWNYLFDREIETVDVPKHRQPPQPETVSLRLERQGIWWWGWRESHHVTVGAVPIMTAESILNKDMGQSAALPGDATNPEMRTNQAVLTLIRWRVLPFPAFLIAPLLLLLLPFLGGGARSVDIENGVPGPSASKSDQDFYYLLQSAPYKTPDPQNPKPDLSMKADIKWEAAPLAWLSLWSVEADKVLGAGPFLRAFTDTVPVKEYYAQRQYTISSLFARDSVKVGFIPLRTSNATVSVRQSGKSVSAKSFTPSGGLADAGQEYKVKKGETVTVSITNGYPSGLDVLVWLASKPEGIEVGGISTVDPKRLPYKGNLLITAKSSDKDGEVILLTTDAKAQMVRIQFE